MATAPDRQARRREATRRKLIDAASALIAERGVQSIRIQEITEAADVGFGSFYNHFDSKEAVVEAVLSEVMSAQAAEIDAVTASCDDPAEIISAAHRSLVRRVARDPDWGSLLLHLDATHHVLLTAFGPYAERDLRRGIASGRLSVPDTTIALHVMGGALVAVMRLVVEGCAPADADAAHAESVLRMLGLDRDEAAQVARRPLPAPL